VRLAAPCKAKNLDIAYFMLLDFINRKFQALYENVISPCYFLIKNPLCYGNIARISFTGQVVITEQGLTQPYL
jgi:hypothetical protein